VVSPQDADAMGHRIVWQTEPLATLDASMQVMHLSGDSVWFGDSAGSVVRVRRDTGETVWRSSTYQGVEKMLSIAHLPTSAGDNVYVLTELASMTLDAVTGNVLRRSRFSHLPSTEPTPFGSYFVFGTGTGLVSWFQYRTGYNWRAASVGAGVHGKVTISGDTAIAAAMNGRVAAIDANTAGVRWTRSLTAAVEAPVAADDGACYVASHDQSLWAFELERGRVRWQYFTQVPLVHPPVRISDGLYLQIPGEGLVSFNPSTTRPEGEVRWKSTAAGDVVARVDTELMVWDRAKRVLAAVDAGTGRVVRSMPLPKAKALTFDTATRDLFVADASGCVERLERLGESTRRGTKDPIADASAAQN
jgi:outer membrane protein assembly factor BamB